MADYAEKRSVVQKGIEKANEKGYIQPYDIAISVMVELERVGFRIQKVAKKEMIRCSDCGKAGEIKGHQDCQYPQD